VSMRASILIADDDPTLRRALADRLTHWGHGVTEAADGRAALEAAERREFDIVLLDLAMPDTPGLTVLRELRERGSAADIVVLTAHGSVENAVEAIRLGAADFLLKPADFELLQVVLERLLERRSLRSTRVLMNGPISPSTALLVRAGQQTGDKELLKAGEEMVRFALSASRGEQVPLGKLQGQYLSRLHAAVARLASGK